MKDGSSYRVHSSIVIADSVRKLDTDDISSIRTKTPSTPSRKEIGISHFMFFSRNKTAHSSGSQVITPRPKPSRSSAPITGYRARFTIEEFPGVENTGYETRGSAVHLLNFNSTTSTGKGGGKRYLAQSLKMFLDEHAKVNPCLPRYGMVHLASNDAYKAFSCYQHAFAVNGYTLNPPQEKYNQYGSIKDYKRGSIYEKLIELYGSPTNSSALARTLEGDYPEGIKYPSQMRKLLITRCHEYQHRKTSSLCQSKNSIDDEMVHARSMSLGVSI